MEESKIDVITKQFQQVHLDQLTSALKPNHKEVSFCVSGFDTGLEWHHFAQKCRECDVKKIRGAPLCAFAWVGANTMVFETTDFRVSKTELYIYETATLVDLGFLLDVCPQITSIIFGILDTHDLVLDDVTIEHCMRIKNIRVCNIAHGCTMAPLLALFAPFVRYLDIEGELNALRPLFLEPGVFCRLCQLKVRIKTPDDIADHEPLFEIMTMDKNCFPRLTSFRGNVRPSLNVVQGQSVTPKFAPELHRMLEANKERLRCAQVLYCILKKLVCKDISKIIVKKFITDCFWKHWRRLVEYRIPMVGASVYPDKSVLFTEIYDSYMDIQMSEKALAELQALRGRYLERVEACDKRIQKAKAKLQKQESVWKRARKQTTLIDSFVNMSEVKNTRARKKIKKTF